MTFGMAVRGLSVNERVPVDLADTDLGRPTGERFASPMSLVATGKARTVKEFAAEWAAACHAARTVPAACAMVNGTLQGVWTNQGARRDIVSHLHLDQTSRAAFCV